MIETTSVRAEGVDVECLVGGSGEPVVLLHGLGDGASTWRGVAERLAARHRVVAPTYLVSPRRSSPAAHAELVLGVLDALGLERVAVVGHSLGGRVAVEVALRQPQRVRALGLVASAGLGREQNPLLLLGSLPVAGEVGVWTSRLPLGPMQRAAARALLQFAHPARVPRAWWEEQLQLARRPGFLEATLAAARGVAGPFGQRELVADDLPRLALPALVAWGRRDRVVPVDHGERAVRLLPNAQLHVLEDCGHALPAERPDALAELLDGFL